MLLDDALAGIDLARGFIAWAPGLAGTAAMARSAIAVMVRLGFTPGFAGMTAPSLGLFLVGVEYVEILDFGLPILDSESMEDEMPLE